MSIKPFLWGCCICLILAELVGGIFAPLQRADFRAFYAAGYLLRTHPTQLYDLKAQENIQAALVSDEHGVLPFYHLDYEALVFMPFSLLKYRQAYLVFLAFSMCLLAGSFFAARTVFSHPIPFWQPRPGLMFFVFLPVLIAVVQGQDSTLSLLLYCLAWRQLENDREMSAGGILALSMFKFHLVIPAAILFSMRSGWRFVVGFFVSLCGVLLLCISMVGKGAILSLIKLLFGAASAIDHGASAQRTMSVYPQFMPNLVGLIQSCGHQLHLSRGISLLTGVCVLALFVWCAYTVRKCEKDAAFSIAILCSLLASYHLYIYDLTLCLLPMALVGRRIHWSVMAGMFGLPVLLFFHLGLDRAFLMAIPMLAMLVNTVMISKRSTAISCEVAHVAPA